MTLEQLRIFVAVAERGHLTQAASFLALTPSAVSASIRSLEERYGTALFDRVGRNIALTAAGHSFLLQAKNTLASAYATELTLIELGNGNRGSLSVQASHTVASYWLPPLLVQFQQSHPQIKLDISLGNTASVVRAVTDGAAEIGFVEGDARETGLLCQAIGTDHFAVIVAPGHPWADGRQVTPDMLLDGQWIMRETGSGTRSAFEAMLKTIGVDSSRLKIALTLPSNESMRSAVMAGPFVAVVSTLVIAADVQSGLLCKVNIDLPPRSFYLLRHPSRYQSQVSLALEQLIALQRDLGTAPHN